MTAASHDVIADQRLCQADALDLEPIVFKLMYPEPGEKGLSLAEADQAVALYRCFLKFPRDPPLSSSAKPIGNSPEKDLGIHSGSSKAGRPGIFRPLSYVSAAVLRPITKGA